MAWRIIALVLMAAGVLKLLDGGSDAPNALVSGGALKAIGVLELVIGIQLLRVVRERTWQRAATLLVLGATAAVLYARASSLPVSACGCFGSIGIRSAGGHFLVNGVILLLCGFARLVEEPMEINPAA